MTEITGFPNPSTHPFTPIEFGSTKCKWCHHHRRAHEEEAVVNLHWSDAIVAARKVQDLTLEEWTNLYLPEKPTSEEIKVASDVARDILLRKGLITEEVSIEVEE